MKKTSRFAWLYLWGRPRDFFTCCCCCHFAIRIANPNFSILSFHTFIFRFLLVWWKNEQESFKEVVLSTALLLLLLSSSWAFVSDPPRTRSLLLERGSHFNLDRPSYEHLHVVFVFQRPWKNEPVSTSCGWWMLFRMCTQVFDDLL